MAKFTPCIRYKRSDGLHPVFIRVFHNRDIQYIKTGLFVTNKGLKTVYDKKGKGKDEIIDKVVLQKCLKIISEYSDRINRMNANIIDCNTLIDEIKNETTELSFTDYAIKFIDGMINQGRENPAKNYKTAVKKLHEHIGKENVVFNELTGAVISAWSNKLTGLVRGKGLYLSAIKTIFDAGVNEYNDYEQDIVRIRTNPFKKIAIPKHRPPKKRSVSADIVKKVLFSDISTFRESSRKELAQDVGKMIFCLAGINAADLNDFGKNVLNRKTWKLCYNRKKTRDKSDSDAYTEITVPELIRPLFDKYASEKRLLCFAERYSDENSFVKAVNIGLGEICDELNIEENVTTYVFRHTWATIAQNQCGASTEMVAFALNHASAHKITEGYIQKDYSPIDVLNKKVIDYVLESSK